MPKPEKVELVASLKERMEGANAMILSDYQGLTVEEMNELRRKLRESEVDYVVAKNTLFKIAANEIGGSYAELADWWKGPIAVAFSEHQVAPAKTIYEYAKDNKRIDKPVLKVGIIDGAVMDVDKLEEIAKLPPLNEIMAKIVGAVTSPLSELVGTLDGVMRGFVVTIDQIAEQKANA